MGDLVCPICSKHLGTNEALVIEHDAVGTLLVRHYIPARLSSIVGPVSHEMIDALPPSKDGLHFDATWGECNARKYCANAGYTKVVFN